MTVILLRTLFLYMIIIFSIRLMGKRQLGELQPSELVITILVSNVATLTLEDTDIPLWRGFLPVLTLVCFEVLSSWLSLKSVRIRRLISGSPQVIIRDGILDHAMLRTLRFSMDDLMTALRMNGIFRLEEVQFAVVETNGSVSVLQKPACQPATKGDLGAVPAQEHSPQLFVPAGRTMIGGKRCIASLCIVLALTGGCMASALLIRRECRQMAVLTDEVTLSVQAGDTAEALARCEALTEASGRFSKVCGYFVSRARLEEIRETVAALPPLVQNELPEAVSELERLREMIGHIYESEVGSSGLS